MMKAKTAHYGNVLQLETQKRLAYLAILGLSQRFVRGIFHPVWHYLILISPLCSGSASGPLIEKASQPRLNPKDIGSICLQAALFYFPLMQSDLSAGEQIASVFRAGCTECSS